MCQAQEVKVSWKSCLMHSRPHSVRSVAPPTKILKNSHHLWSGYQSMFISRVRAYPEDNEHWRLYRKTHDTAFCTKHCWTSRLIIWFSIHLFSFTHVAVLLFLFHFFAHSAVVFITPLIAPLSACTSPNDSRLCLACCEWAHTQTHPWECFKRLCNTFSQ